MTTVARLQAADTPFGKNGLTSRQLAGHTSLGAVERANRTVQEKLVTWMKDNTKHRSEGLRFVQLQMNTQARFKNTLARSMALDIPVMVDKK